MPGRQGALLERDRRTGPGLGLVIEMRRTKVVCPTQLQMPCPRALTSLSWIALHGCACKAELSRPASEEEDRAPRAQWARTHARLPRRRCSSLGSLGSASRTISTASELEMSRTMKRRAREHSAQLRPCGSRKLESAQGVRSRDRQRSRGESCRSSASSKLVSGGRPRRRCRPARASSPFQGAPARAHDKRPGASWSGGKASRGRGNSFAERS